MGSSVRKGTRRAVWPVALVVALAVVVSGASAVAAVASYQPVWWAASYVCCFTWRTTADSFVARIQIKFNQAQRDSIRNYNNQGRFYTQDAKDRSNNVNATPDATSDLPSPAYDIDDDNGNSKAEESEVTVTATNWPTVGIVYNFRPEYSRWFKPWPEPWQWDSDSGTIDHESQISYHPCAFCEWDSVFHSGIYASITYPRQLRTTTASASATTTDAPDARHLPPASVRLERGAPYRLAPQEAGEALITPDLSRGIGRYRDVARARAVATLRAGPGLGVATFARPLDGPDLAELERLGLEFITVEGTAERARGAVRRVTPNAAWRAPDQTIRRLREQAAGLEAELTGAVAANVRVSSAAAYRRLARDPRVYLIDLSIEEVSRAYPGLDLVLNDLSWQLMGWDT